MTDKPELGKGEAPLEQKYSAIGRLLDDAADNQKSQALAASPKQADNADKGFFQATAHSFAYSVIQAPAEGVAQIFDHTIGVAFDTNLYKHTKNALVSAPAPAEFGTAEWHGQQIGGALAAIPWFIATRAGLRGVAGTVPATRALLVSSTEAAVNKQILSGTGIKLALEGGMTGAAYAGLFKPVEAQNGSFAEAKLKSMATDFATFSTLSATSIYLNPKLGALALPAVEKAPAASALIGRGTAALSGALSGIPGAIVQTTTEHALSPERGAPTFKEIAQNAYAFGIIGAGMNAVTPNANLENYVARSAHTRSEKTGPTTPPGTYSETVMSGGKTTNSTATATEHAEITIPFVKKNVHNFQSEDLAMQAEKSVLDTDASAKDKKGKLIISFGVGDNIFPKYPEAKNLSPNGAVDFESMFKTVTDVQGETPAYETFTQLPNAFDFSQALPKHGIGEIPEHFLGEKVGTIEAFEKLNALANSLRSLDAVLPPQKKSGLGTTDLGLQPLQIKLGDKTIAVEKIGIGEVAHVYKLSVDGHDYAFKVPNDPARMDVHGFLAETAAFAYLQKHKINDLIDFHAASASSKDGWILTEYVANPRRREGASLADILARENLQLGDDWSANRGPGNVVWDLGGIEPKAVKRPTSLEEVRELLLTPEGDRIGARILDGIKNQADLKQALLLCLERPSIGGQVARTAARRLSNPADLADVLSAAFDKNGAAGRAAFELDVLANTPYIKDLFYKGLDNPESRVETAKMIDKLPAEERSPAFNKAMIYPEARPMAARSIASLPQADRAAATALAMEYPGSKYVVYQQRALQHTLNAAEVLEKDTALHQYLQSFGIESGVLPEGGRDRLTFKQWEDRSKTNADEFQLSILKKQGLEKIWDYLTDAQTKLNSRDFNQILDHWSELPVNAWKRMTPAEVRRFVQICESLPSIGDGRAIFDSPDIYPWLESNKDLGGRDAGRVISNWRDIPLKLKQIAAGDLVEVGKAMMHMQKRNWQVVAPEDAGVIARALNKLAWRGIDKDLLLEHPGFSHWFSQHESGMSRETKYDMSKVLEVWGALEPADKLLPPDAMLTKAGEVRARLYLEKHLGKDSSTLQYLHGLDDGKGTVLTPVKQWIHSIDHMESRLAHAKSTLADLVKEGADASKFELWQLQKRSCLDRNFSDRPSTRAKLMEVLSTRENSNNFVDWFDGRSRRKESTIKLIEHALENGFTGTATDVQRIRKTAVMAQNLELEDAGTMHLYKLSRDIQKLNALDEYLGHKPSLTATVKALIYRQADWTQLDAKHLMNEVYFNKLPDFSDEQKAQLRALKEQGLSMSRLYNHVQEAPGQAEAIKHLLGQRADVRQLNNFMSLSVYPESVALKLVEADKQGLIRTADVIGKTKDLQSGRYFHKLLIDRVESVGTLSENLLDAMTQRAAEDAARNGQKSHYIEGRQVQGNNTNAVTFNQAAQAIMNTIPSDRPVVLLGRDAWPLVPILRSIGRDAQYFMWSRLQNTNEPTHKQWLKEVPPNAAVIDTGFAGSIIDVIREIDPGVKGYLMSSSTPKYQQLLRGGNHHEKVTQIENMPKLVNRSHSHTENGGTISRRMKKSEDTDNTLLQYEQKSRWYVERYSRDLLSATGLPKWDAWRYSQFAGLTPQERLGLRNRVQVEQHYKNVEALRAANASAVATATK